MSQTFGSDLTPEDVEEALDVSSTPPSATTAYEPTDSYLASEARAFEDTPPVSESNAPGSIRHALKSDADQGRQWVTDRASRVGDVIREEPLKATVYALVGGVFLGMLLRR